MTSAVSGLVGGFRTFRGMAETGRADGVGGAAVDRRQPRVETAVSAMISDAKLRIPLVLMLVFSVRLVVKWPKLGPADGALF